MASRFWVGGTGNWDASDTTHWAASTGGAGGQSVPGASDTVTFDVNSCTAGQIVTLATSPSVTTGTWSGTFIGVFDTGANSPTFGNVVMGVGATVNMGSGTWTLTGTGSCWAVNSASVIGAQTSTIKITSSGALNTTFSGASHTYNNLWWNRGTGTNNNTINGNNTFNDIKDDGTEAHSDIFIHGTTQIFKTLHISGSAGKLITLTSDSTATYALTCIGGTVVTDYLDVYHAVLTPTWYLGANSIIERTVTEGSGGVVGTSPKSPSTLPFLIF